MLLALLLTACGARQPAALVTGSAVHADGGPTRLPFADLRDVACLAGEPAPRCWALAGGRLVALDVAMEEVPVDAAVAAALAGADGLRADAGLLRASGPCAVSPDASAPLPICERTLSTADWTLGPEVPSPPLPAAEDAELPVPRAAERFTAAHNRAVAAGWRSAFHRVLVGPGGALLTWTRGLDDAGQLGRTAPGRATVRIQAPRASVSYPGWLALHPTGTEAYLLPWPSPVLIAFDPVTLATRWTLPLDGAGHGLFVDAAGRFLLAATGSPEVDRWVDWPLAGSGASDAAEPARDEVLRAADRPPSSAVVAVDLATGEEAARANGRFRRWLTLPDGRFALATDREVVFFRPKEPHR